MLWWKSLVAVLFALVASVSAHSPQHHQSYLFDDPSSKMVLISDVLSRRETNIFSGLIRDDYVMSKQLGDSSFNATVLAPLNGEMTKLPRKPWEDAGDYSKFGANAYEGPDGGKRAEENLKRFVQSHIVPKSPWESGQKVKTLAGREVWWETKDGKQVIQPDGIAVESVADQVANGEVWILAGVMKV